VGTKSALSEETDITLSVMARRRELLGWCGAMTYMFLMMFGHQLFVLGSAGFSNGNWVDSVAMIAFALSITAFSLLFGRKPDQLARLARPLTLVAIAFTVILGLLPDPYASILFVAACVLMGPVIARTVYGVIRTSRSNARITRYMIGWTTALCMFAVWVIINPPRDVAFLIPALFAALSLVGTGRSPAIPEASPTPQALKFSKSSVLVLVLMLLVMLWFNLMADMLLNNLFAGGDVSSKSAAALGALLAWVPLAIGLLVFAIISDKGHEKGGFIAGIGLFLISVLCLILMDGTKSIFYVPLAVANVIGAMYVVFFACSFSIYFLLPGAKRPIFTTSIGCIFLAAFESVCWLKSLYLPKSLVELGKPLYVTAAISAIIFAALVYFFYEHYQESTLASALYDLLYGDRSQTHAVRALENSAALPAGVQPASAASNLLNSAEIDVALLLVEGETRHDISRRLHRPIADINQTVEAIREKVIRVGDAGPEITLIAREFKLTRREIDTLRCLCQNMTNAAIATELVISEETAKKHVRSLMTKLPVTDRKEVATWVESLSQEAL